MVEVVNITSEIPHTEMSPFISPNNLMNFEYNSWFFTGFAPEDDEDGDDALSKTLTRRVPFFVDPFPSPPPWSEEG